MIFYVLGIFLVCAGLNRLQAYLFKRLWHKNLTVELLFRRDHAFEGETVAFEERLTNYKRFPIPFVKVTYVLPSGLRQTDLQGRPTYEGSERNTVFFVPGRRAVTRKTRVECRKRGYYPIREASLASANLFLVGFLSMKALQNAALTVYPKEISVSDTDIPYKRLTGDVTARRFILPDPFEFTGVREYQPFDSLRQVNFKAWARTGQLMSNIYGYTTAQVVKIYLNMEKYGVKYYEAVYENALRLAAFLAEHYITRDIPVYFFTNGVDCVTGAPAVMTQGQSQHHLRAIYETLARIDVEKSLYTTPMAHHLPARYEDGVTILLISPYCGEELQAAYAEMKKAGVPALWIVPCAPGEKKNAPGGSDIVLWEGSHD